jgi:predicted esterase
LIFATPGATPVTSQPAPINRPVPGLDGVTVVNTSLNGDPTRIVYPGQALAAGQLYPVVIFHHGYGMDQTQFTDRTGLAAAAVKEGWISASATFGGRSHWGNDTALRQTAQLIQELVANHQVDPKRIYLVGFSMGGGTALMAAANPLQLPYRVAAVASTQGFTDLTAMTTEEAGGGVYAKSVQEAYGGTVPADHSPQAMAASLQGIPVYLEHGSQDTSVRVSHAYQMDAKLTELGIAHEFKIYNGLGHSEATINEEAIMNFLRGKVAP